MAIGLIVVLSVLLVGTVCNACGCGGGPALSSDPPPLPRGAPEKGVSADPAINAARELQRKAQGLFGRASEEGLDVSGIEPLIAQADVLLKRAIRIKRIREPSAIGLANQAASLYKAAISGLEALLQ